MGHTNYQPTYSKKQERVTVDFLIGNCIYYVCYFIWYSLVLLIGLFYLIFSNEKIFMFIWSVTLLGFWVYYLVFKYNFPT